MLHNHAEAELQENVAAGFTCLQHKDLTDAELEALWHKLPGGAVSTPFQTLEFLEAFSRHMTKTVNAGHRLLEVRATGSDQPLLLLPLIIRPRGFVRIASIPDLTLADQNAPIVARKADIQPDQLDALWSAIVAQLDGIDIVDIFNIPAQVGGLENPLFSVAKAAVNDQFYLLDLKEVGDVDPRLKSRRKKLQKDMRSKWRRLEEQGCRLECVEDTQERIRLCDTIFKHKQKRFDEIGVQNVLSSSAVENFYRKVIENSRPEEPVVMHAIYHGDEVLGATMCLVANGLANCVLLSMGSEEWQALSPGMVALTKTIEWARGAGYSFFSLGTGTQDYKKRFGFETHDLKRILFPLTLKGQAHIKLSKLKSTFHRD
ncbi:MAG: GNAT family N-acetyltransferase [Rhodobacteraceae bacterium]|nr:GNAT family N-acetyltransferase [Paracoccaceae bacterium]